MACLTVLSASARAQDSDSDVFFSAFAFLRATEAPCPAGLDFIPQEAIPQEAVCYRHSHSDFFDFKEAFNQLGFEARNATAALAVRHLYFEG